mmetsp:Transcript_90058/g.259596  ORF Transcript_90058/g.259596 Transcript_90058/m.259596 type:complete len:559 (-) Transcript_90058:61-1737(-)
MASVFSSGQKQLQLPREQASVKSPQSVEDVQVDVDFLFVPVSRLYAGAFFATLILSAFATFKAVEWSADTDKIVLYYGFINPCILFDHYPAKVVAMTGMSFFILLGVLYDWMIFFQAYCERRLAGTVWAGIVVWTVTLIHMAFVNVFVTNLYPPEEASGRRLHGVHAGLNGTLALIEEPMFGETPLTPQDMQVIVIHTAFYIVWLLGEIWMMSLLITIRRDYIFSRPFWNKVGYGVFAFIAILGMGMHAAAMMVIILQDKPKPEWYFREEMKNSVQWAIIYIDAKLFTSAWGWIPVMFYRWVFSPGIGVRLTMGLHANDADGSVLPEWWVGRAFQATAAVLVAGGAFVLQWQTDNTTFFRLAAPLRSKPFAYFGAPVLLASFVFVGAGLFLTCVQRNLMRGRTDWWLNVNALVMFFSLVGCMLIVLERERFTYIFFFSAVACYCTWVLQLSWSSNRVIAIIYCMSGLALLFGARMTNYWVLYYIFVFWLCCYNPVVPDGSLVYVKVAKLVDFGDRSMSINIDESLGRPAIVEMSPSGSDVWTPIPSAASASTACASPA